MLGLKIALSLRRREESWVSVTCKWCRSRPRWFMPRLSPQGSSGDISRCFEINISRSVQTAERQDPENTIFIGYNVCVRNVFYFLWRKNTDYKYLETVFRKIYKENEVIYLERYMRKKFVIMHGTWCC
jgi:hypothetical protein